MDREKRYVVFKISDIEKYLPKDVKFQLGLIAKGITHNRGVDGRPPLDCVVVEHDWPMYEQTWTSIEGWVNKLDLESQVREALSNAKQNGYDFVGKVSSEVARDLISYDSDLESEDFSLVYDAVNVVTLNG